MIYCYIVVVCVSKTDQLEELHMEWSLGSEHEDCTIYFQTACHPPYQLKQLQSSSFLNSISHHVHHMQTVVCLYDKFNIQHDMKQTTTTTILQPLNPG